MADNDNKPKDDNQSDNRLAELEKQINEAVAKNDTKTDKVETPPIEEPKIRPSELSSGTANTSSVKKSARATSTSAAPAKSARTGILWFFTVVNLIIVFSLGAAGYWFWMQWQQSQTQQSSFLASQQSALDAQTQANASLQQSLTQKNQQLQSTVDALSQKLTLNQQQIAANSDNLADVTGRRPSDWLIAEADYLVRMAGRKLWLENDVNTAILMLQSADSRLQDLADPSLLPIRQLLANDVQSLQQINNVSLTSVALALSSLTPQVKNLPLAIQEVPELNTNEPDADQSWLEELRDYVSANMFNFEPRMEGESIKPVLSLQQQWLVKEQLKHTLLQTQTAVLQEQDTLFQQSVQRSLEIIIENFDLQDPRVEDFISSIQNLTETDLKRVYPDQLESALPLKDLLEKRVKGAFSTGMSEL